MRILITNDDGVYSPGIAALAQVASRFGEVRIVAPDVEMSSTSASITSSRPLSYKRTQLPTPGLEAYRVNGTPGDCVMLGTTLWEKVDVVLSGINIGLNLGNAIWHSGTLAGAKQAALLGLRGIALSAPATDREQPDFELLKPWVASVLGMLFDVPDLPLVNVNFPAKAPRGTRWTCQSMRHYDGKVVPAKDPMGRQIYWYTVVPVEATEESSDRSAFEQGYVSMTPLRLDLTDPEALERVRKLEAWQKLKFA
ncbi:MAG TPA: 5'/3'-nucleotidase SurE [Burkholderiales bacterium]|jgi:5'-nucleotidase|nr:5'/3'-nucleotidase SurE [Burkholderiales bacterium]